MYVCNVCMYVRMYCIFLSCRFTQCSLILEYVFTYAWLYVPLSTMFQCLWNLSMWGFAKPKTSKHSTPHSKFSNCKLALNEVSILYLQIKHKLEVCWSEWSQRQTKWRRELLIKIIVILNSLQPEIGDALLIQRLGCWLARRCPWCPHDQHPPRRIKRVVENPVTPPELILLLWTANWKTIRIGGHLRQQHCAMKEIKSNLHKVCPICLKRMWWLPYVLGISFL